MGNSIMTIQRLLKRIKLSVLGLPLHIYVNRDQRHVNGRLYLQVAYNAPCTKTGMVQTWKGRKWYLSEFMTRDEVVKTAYAAFKAAVEHEVMEGFTIDGKVLFNPHVSFEALLSITDQEVQRKEVQNG